ncbi:MAG TPA: hypothetical protein VGB20_04350 [bacterium]
MNGEGDTRRKHARGKPQKRRVGAGSLAAVLIALLSTAFWIGHSALAGMEAHRDRVVVEGGVTPCRISPA